MKNFEIYKNMDKIDFSELIDAAGECSWPKNKRYTVVSNGIEFKVSTYLAKGQEKIDDVGYDAYSAIESVHIRELKNEEIPYENDGTPQYSNPEFDRTKLVRLEEDEFDRRVNFLCAVANLLNDQATMEAIIDAAVKKKNGTLYKNRVLKIACSGISDFWNGVYAIVGRAKSDTTMSIVVENVLCKAGDNDLWANDFISVYHDGLRISEALEKVL